MIETKIPHDWEIKSLGDLGEVLSGLTYSPSDISSDGTLVLRSSNVQERFLAFEDNVYVKASGFKPVKEKDILICVRNGSKSLIGKNALITKDAENMAFGAFMAIYRSEYNEYLFQLFDTDFYNREIHRNLGATINSINGSDLKRFKFPIPPLPEQRAITKVLGSMDKAINANNQLIAQKELRKKWLMQNLLTGKKRLKGYQGEWKKCTGNDFLDQRKEQAPNDGKIPLFSLTIENGVTEKSERYEREFLVKDKNVKKYKIVYPNDIVFNPANLRWGAIAKHTRSFKVLLSPIYQVLPVKKGFDIDFISYLVSSPRQIAYYASILEGTLIERMAVKVEPFLATKYQIPNLEEQTAIARVLLAADKEISLLKTKVEKLHEQKKGLMQQLLTGKKRLV